jgi:MarR family transcriptional regulator, organic hydroperoxide resistance regulator
LTSIHGFVDHPPLPLLPSPPEIENLDSTTLQAFHALGRAFHLHRQAMQRKLSNPETHHGALISLRLLTRTDGISQREFAEALHLSRPRVTSILQGLERAGAVRREADPADQRVTRVFLTPEGRRQERENRAAFEDYVQQTVGRLTDVDKVELTRILDEVSGHIAQLVCPATQEQEARTS